MEKVAGGASIAAVFTVDPEGADALRPGGQIRFIVGNKGGANSKSGSGFGGGGGGTGILYLAPTDNAEWEPLIIAGGGGGGAAEQNTGSAYEEDGGNANTETCGDNSATDAGDNGAPGVSFIGAAGAGGGWNGSATEAGGQSGGGDVADPMGGVGGTSYGSGGDGGFGCGGGGAGHRSGGHYGGGGGGGGYSGGGAGESTNNNDEAGGGGGSFIDSRAANIISSTRSSGQNQEGQVWVQTIYEPDSGEKILDGPTILLDPSSDVEIAYADYRDGVESELPAYDGFDLYLNSIDVTPGYNTFMLDGEPGSYQTVYLAFDQFGELGSASQTITLLPPELPTFSLSGDVIVDEDSGAYSAVDFADNISVHYTGVSFVGFTVTNDSNVLFASQPTISNEGTLSFTPAADAYGSATITVVGCSDISETEYADSDPQAFTITVNRNFSDDPPDNLSLDNDTVFEGSTAVGTASVDSFSGDTITYSLADNNDAEFFQIDPETGVLGFLAAPDFEDPQDNGQDNVYLVNILATGDEGQDQLQASITVSNVEEPPTDVTLSATSIVENNTLVGTVTATDPTGGIPSFHISGGADADLFQVDASTGELSFLLPPDYEQPTDADEDNIYFVAVEVSGDGTTGASFQITVMNTNESPTDLQLSQTEVAENSTEVGTFSATDPEGSQVFYTLSGGDDASLFSVSYSTGALSFRSAPDYEAPEDADGDNVYEFNIRATDNSRSAVTSVQITVTNAAESAVSEFRSFYGLAADGSEDEDDWSSNGVANILYLVFGLGDPNEAIVDQSLLPRLTLDGSTIIHSYRYAFPVDGYSFSALTSNDLTNWDAVSSLVGTEEAPTNVDAESDGAGFIRVTTTYPVTAARRFFLIDVNTATTPIE